MTMYWRRLAKNSVVSVVGSREEKISLLGIRIVSLITNYAGETLCSSGIAVQKARSRAGKAVHQSGDSFKVATSVDKTVRLRAVRGCPASLKTEKSCEVSEEESLELPLLVCYDYVRHSEMRNPMRE